MKSSVFSKLALIVTVMALSGCVAGIGAAAEKAVAASLENISASDPAIP